LKVKRDTFVKQFLEHPNMRHDLEFLKEFKDFVKKRALGVVALIFLEIGVILYWKELD
jgi:hypothetical protein